MEGNRVASFRICVTVPLCAVCYNIMLALTGFAITVYIILAKDFSTFFLPETRPLVYRIKAFSGTPTEAVYYIYLKLSA